MAPAYALITDNQSDQGLDPSSPSFLCRPSTMERTSVQELNSIGLQGATVRQCMVFMPTAFVPRHFLSLYFNLSSFGEGYMQKRDNSIKYIHVGSLYLCSLYSYKILQRQNFTLQCYLITILTCFESLCSLLFR